MINRRDFIGITALPEWAAEFDAKTWAQFFLKYVISHPAITATPATRKVTGAILEQGSQKIMLEKQ